jgi:hypothetical protein
MFLKGSKFYLSQQRVSILLISFLLIPLLSFSQFSFLNAETKLTKRLNQKNILQL